MPSKTPGTPRKGSAAKKSTKQSTSVTPIDKGLNQNSTGASASPRDMDHLEPQIQEEIRRRAYELYEERGRQDGFHHEDWERAKSEVLSRYHREKSA